MLEPIPLSLACQRLSCPWVRGWRYVLEGDLCGEKIRGRWYVTKESLERLVERVGNSSHPPEAA